ncbi:MAG: R3H domain-containing nucleic acid-binding protein [bacterium]
MNESNTQTAHRAGDDRRPRGGGHGRGGRPYRYGGGRSMERNRQDDQKIQRLIRNAQEMLEHSTHAICLEELNAYERKRIHQFYDNKSDFETKTYRNGEDFLLWIFPVGKLRQYAEEKAKEALETGGDIDLPPMSNYERFIIHDALKSMESVETNSHGENEERYIRITPIKFGRRLKRMVKKLKLF